MFHFYLIDFHLVKIPSQNVTFFTVKSPSVTERLITEENALRGYCTPNKKLACFVAYPKLINTFW